MSNLDLQMALKLKLKPSWFIEEVIGAEMFPMQRQLMNDFYGEHYKDLTLACGMRSLEFDTPILFKHDKHIQRGVIGEIQEGDYVVNPSGEWVQVHATYSYEADEVIELKCSGNKIIRCSPTHRFPLVGAVKEAKDLVIGDVLLEASLYYEGEAQELEANNTLKQRPIQETWVVDEKFAFWCGKITADGYFGNYLGIAFNMKEQEQWFIDQFLWWWFEHTGYDIYLSKTNNCFEVRILASAFRDMLNHYGLGGKFDTKRVPGFIWNSPSEVREAYLLGFLQGMQNHDGSKFSFTFGVTNKELRDDLLLLAWSLGWRTRREQVLNWSGNMNYKGTVSKTERSISLVIKEIQQTKRPVTFVDLTVDGEYFAIDCGIMTHNSGKSVLGAMFAVVEFAQLLALPEPQDHYGLLHSQPIFVSIISTSESQALDSVFSNARSMIEDDDKFFSSFDLSIRELVVRDKSRNIVLKTLSSWSTTAIGRSNKTVVLDELSNFEKTAGRRGAWEIYTRLRKSTDTFHEDGHTIAISSPQHSSDIIMTLYRREAPNALRLLKPTWEMNPNYTEAELRKEHRYDLAAFFRDYACEPGLTSGQAFPKPLNFKQTRNILLETNPHITTPHVLAIDPAVKNDAFGVAIGYKDRYGMPVIDGVMRFIKEEGKPYISPAYVKEFLTSRIKTHCFDTVVFDVWFFPELIETLENDHGVPCVKHIVKKEDYDRWRELDANDDISVVFDDTLKFETENLLIVNPQKVDHPPFGSKDVADCVANVLWYLTTQKKTTETPMVLSAY